VATPASPRPTNRRRVIFFLSMGKSMVVLLGCAARAAGIVGRLRGRMVALLVRSLILACLLIGAPVAAQLPPVIVVPGAPGTELVDSTTGKRVWPSPWLMVYPM